MEGMVSGMPALRRRAVRRRAVGRRSVLRTASPFLVAAVVVLAIAAAPGAHPRVHFVTGHSCFACHNSLTTAAGEDASIGFDWRASIMANSSRDPYWQASVRREVLEHPEAQATIEDECATCHMPMARFEARTSGSRGAVFAHLPQQRGTEPLDSLAADGVSCTLCHQIQPNRLGDSSSFDGGFVIDSSRFDPSRDAPKRPVFGPFEVDRGHTTIMHSATGFVPTEGAQIRQSELCATCHTLYTPTLGPAGEPIGRLPEQVPFLEWRHSAYRDEQSCQDCHMPAVGDAHDSVPITAVLGRPRPGVRRHVFVGGNFFVLGMLNRYRPELAVEALPQELNALAGRTREFLSQQAARVAVEPQEVAGGRLLTDVVVINRNGHKLPTAFPSRRAWLQVTVRDRAGAVVFESGAITPAGRIVGNDNDDDRTKYEPHYREITRPDQVEIYESILVDPKGAVTTGLLSGVRYIKDNRLLPRGFDKATADSDIAVVGDAASDPAFAAGTDRMRYRIDVSRAEGPFRVEAELWYQPIGFRWAHNLTLQRAPETDRFVAYYDSMAAASAIVLARDSAVVR
jgi:hypothetical protein